MTGAYILLIVGVSVWALMVPLRKGLSDTMMRAITVFGGAFLLAVCFLELVPEMAESYCYFEGEKLHGLALSPFFAVLIGFLIQQVLEKLSSHAEHGHIEHSEHDGTVIGLMTGLSLHAFLEGMPLVSQAFVVDRGLMWGIFIHNIPVSLILVGIMVNREYGFWRVLALLTLFAVMTPLGSLTRVFLLQPNYLWSHFIIGMVVGVLLHVSSSILFDHKHSKLNTGLIVLAFVVAYFTI